MADNLSESLFAPNYSLKGSYRRFNYDLKWFPTNLSSSNMFKYFSDEEEFIVFGFDGPLLSSNLHIGDDQYTPSLNDFFHKDNCYFIRSSPSDLIILIHVNRSGMSLDLIGEAISDFGCRNVFDIGVHDNHRFWLQVSSERDYCHIMSMRSTFFESFNITFYKWTSFDNPHGSNSFPTSFILHSFHEDHLSPKNVFLACAPIGRPLRYELPLHASRPHNPVVLIEVDHSYVLPDRVLFSFNRQPDYWIGVEAVSTVPYCILCDCIGHMKNYCNIALGDEDPSSAGDED